MIEPRSLWLVNPRLRLAVPLAFYCSDFDGWTVQSGLDKRLADAFLVEGYEGEAVDWVVQHEGSLSPGLRVLGVSDRPMG